MARIGNEKDEILVCPSCGVKEGQIHKDGCNQIVVNKIHDKANKIGDYKHLMIKEEVAKRNPVDYRYDILDKTFLHMMAQIAHYGASKYGDYNWQKSRLSGDKGPINHIYDHLRQYQLGILHDRFDTLDHQLAAIAFNAMMEFYYLNHNIDKSE